MGAASVDLSSAIGKRPGSPYDLLVRRTREEALELSVTSPAGSSKRTSLPTRHLASQNQTDVVHHPFGFLMISEPILQGPPDVPVADAAGRGAISRLESGSGELGTCCGQHPAII